MMKQLSNEKKSEIIAYNKIGKSEREISILTQVPRSTIGNILRNYIKRGTLNRYGKSGRKLCIQTEDIEILLREVKLNPKISAAKLAIILKNKTGKDVTPQTIRNYLKKNSYKSRIACKKPLLKKKNKIARFEISKKWINWCKTEWNDVIFSDECKFNVFYNSNRKIWRKDGTRLSDKNIIPTIKHGGGSVMVWGCMSHKGVGNLVFIDEIMDKYLYANILANNLVLSASKMGMDRYIFQHDNDPKHSSKFVSQFLEENKIEVLNWPSRSPDINPIEHVWAHMKRELRGKMFKNKNDLKMALLALWEDISQEFLEKLVQSMPRRVKAVLSEKGGHTSY